MLRYALISSVYMALLISAQAQVPTDFDADGISDLTHSTVAGDNTLTWQAELSSSGATLKLGSIGLDGDSPMVAIWDSAEPRIGVVKVDSDGQTLLWSIINGASGLIDRTFGKAGDLAVSGADLNGDGRADAVVVRVVSGKARWEIAYDLFNPLITTPASETVTFGKIGDRVFFARVDGAALDWIGVIGKGRGNRSVAKLKNLITGEVRRYTKMPKFASTGSRPRAFGIRQEGGADLIGFELLGRSNTTIKVYSLAGALVSSASFKGTGQSVVGDFNEGSGYEVAFQGQDESAVFNPVSGEKRIAVFAGGTAVDEINLHTVGAVSSPPDETEGGGISSCARMVRWPGSHIYKTIGSDHFTDIRRNTAGVILKEGASGPFPSCIRAIDTQGNTIASLGLYARGAGWAARYYAGYGCGSGSALNGSAIATQARQNTGSANIYLKFDDVCYGPVQADRCVNSSSC